MTRLERMKTFPKEQNYSMFTQEGNLAVNRMMIELIETLQGKSKVSEDDFKTLLEKGVNSVDASGHGEVYDTAVREVVLGILEKEVEKSGYSWSMVLEI